MVMYTSVGPPGQNRYRSMSQAIALDGSPRIFRSRSPPACSSDTREGRLSPAARGVSWMNTVKIMANKAKDNASSPVNTPRFGGGEENFPINGIDHLLSPTKDPLKVMSRSFNTENAEDFAHEYSEESPESVVTTTSVSPSGDTRTTTTKTIRTRMKEENGQRTSIVHNTQHRVMFHQSRIESPVDITISGDAPSFEELTKAGPTQDGWSSLRLKGSNELQLERTASQPSNCLLSSIAQPARPSSVETMSPFQRSSKVEGDCSRSFHDMDMAIEATLQKTMETFQRMVDQEREQLLRMFPQLANSRLTARADQAPATEVITERRVQPDGTIVEVQRVITRQLLQVHKSVSMINGVIKNTSARAVLEYQGPQGGYRVKIEDADATPEADSETEEDDDADRASIAPSEFSDTESVMAFQQRKSSSMGKKNEVAAVGGDTVLSLQTSPKRKAEKAWYAAQELVESERRYVEKLHLLDQVFRTRVQQDPETSRTIGGDKLSKLFSNIGSLYSLHNDHLLPQLEVRLSEWQSTQKIGDVIRRLAPFLKIYSEYTSNYKKATKTYEELRKRNKRFAAIIEEIEKLPECDHLPLSNHIICPIQRVTRYHLLMTEYLKNLHDGHQDKEDTFQALELTKSAAAHANDMMRQLDKYKHVIQVQELLGTQIHELLTPSRELVKQGRLMKISARNGEHQIRYVFLFNDMLLLCSDRRNVVISALGSKYKLRAIFEVGTMHVLEGDNLEVENTFYVRSGNKTIELYSTSSREKTEWMETLWSVIQDFSHRMQSFRKTEEIPQDSNTSPDTPASPTPTPTTPPQPGTTPPSSNPSRCTTCQSGFSTFKKAYTCKSCGGTFCKKCCQKKIKLVEGEKEQRVCTSCFEKVKNTAAPIAVSPTLSNGDSPEHRPTSSPVRNGAVSPNQPSGTPDQQQITRKSILEVKPSDSCILSGYLDFRVARKWDKRYFALHEDFVLYAFKADTDASARTSMPITGCKVGLVDQRQDSSISSKDAHAFKLEHKRRVYYFKAPNPETMAKWVAALDLASQAQFPIP